MKTCRVQLLRKSVTMSRIIIIKVFLRSSSLKLVTESIPNTDMCKVFEISRTLGVLYRHYKPYEHVDASRLQCSGYSFPAGHNRKFLFRRERKPWIRGSLRLRLHSRQFAKFAAHGRGNRFLPSTEIKKHQHTRRDSSWNRTITTLSGPNPNPGSPIEPR